MSNNLSESIYKQDGKSPGAWVVRDPTPEEMPDVLDYISTELGFLECVLDQDKMDEYAGAAGFWEWDIYQEEYFKTTSWFISNKCRQSGGSAGLAAKFFARGMLSGTNYTGVFTSYKKEEAANKVDYVRQYLAALPPRFKKKVIRDPQQLLEFENANGTKIKIFSHAQKPIRGIAADHIGLDELAFYQWADDIYSSALPATAMVRGSVDIVSTPFGKSGKFYEIFSDPFKFPEYRRMSIMWWHCKRYLKDNSDQGLMIAAKIAPLMTTEERVYKLGSESIIKQFENASDLETFQQEFEGLFVDEQAAFFSKDLIISVMFDNDVSSDDDYEAEDSEFINITAKEALQHRNSLLEAKYENIKTATGKAINFKRYDSPETVWAEVRSGRISGRLVAGVDVGTTRNSTDFRIFEEVTLEDNSTLMIERFGLNRQRWDLDDQEMYFDHILTTGHLDKMGMDVNGIGRQMGQSLQKKHYGNFIPIELGGSNKIQEEIMTNLRARMEMLSIALVYDKKIIEEIYAIERFVRDNMSIGFKSDEKRRHHADAAWSIGIAAHLATPANAKSQRMADHRLPNREPKFAKRTDSVHVNHNPLRKPDTTLLQRALSPVDSSHAHKHNVLSDLLPGTFIHNYDE